MDIQREGGRGANQLRPIDCVRDVLNRAHGSVSCSHGETRVLAAVYGPKAGTKKNENPEKACLEVIWKPKIGQIGKTEKEFEMILKRTLQNICLLTVHPNTTTSIIIQVVHDDGSVSFFDHSSFLMQYQNTELDCEYRAPSAPPDEFYCDFLALAKLLPCAIHAACAALVDAGIPLKYLAVAICCCLVESGRVILDPNKIEEQRMKALVHLVFPSPVRSVLSEGSMEDGIITSLSHGVMTVDDYFQCVKQGQAAIVPLSNILKKKLQSQSPSSQSVTG